MVDEVPSPVREEKIILALQSVQPRMVLPLFRI